MTFQDTSGLTTRQLEALRRREYNGFSPIGCPLMDGELVYFQAAGFYHLTHNGRRALRNDADQRRRLNLLPCVREVISRADYFGADERVLVKILPNGRSKNIYFYEVTYRFNDEKTVSVVLRRKGDHGKLEYYSVKYKSKPQKRRTRPPLA